MELLHKHYQIKVEKKHGLDSTCDIKLFGDSTTFEYNSFFVYKYLRLGCVRTLQIEHIFVLNKIDGNIETSHKIKNDGVTEEKMYNDYSKTRRNDFQMFQDLLKNSFVRGEKKHGYWGIKYSISHNKIIKTITDALVKNFRSDFFLKKYKNVKVPNLFEFIVDYHLDVKGIKPHNNVYKDILVVYPKKIWLKKNDNKFLPSILDSLNIKKKYLVSELSENSKRINIPTLNYLCKLFGENFIDYLKLIDWKSLCSEIITNKKTHRLKNESEKKCLVSIFNKWNKSNDNLDDTMNSINKVFELRKNIELKGIKLRFNPKNIQEYETIFESWQSLKTHLTKGYKNFYNFPENFLVEIEDPIVMDDKVYIPKILKTEDDYKIEGVVMKNCMGKQFKNGINYIYVSLATKNKRINLQYRKGALSQCFGKANTKTPDEFKKPIQVLSERFENHKDVTWTKQKYDIIK